MVNTREPDSYVLFADAADNNTVLSYRFLHLPTGHTIVDVPIRAGDKPNTFVDPYTLRNGQLRQRIERVCVPPEDGVLTVDIRADREEYGPGEEARVQVRATGPDGEPVAAQVALGVFDKAMYATHREFVPPIAEFFHGRFRTHHGASLTNLSERFAAGGGVRRLYRDRGMTEPWYGRAPDWNRPSLPSNEGRAWISQEDFRDLLEHNRGKPRRRLHRHPADQEPYWWLRWQVEPRPEGRPSWVPSFLEAQVRQRTFDASFWAEPITTGPDGEAEFTFAMPEDPATWQISAWVMDKDTRVGQAQASVTTIAPAAAQNR
jgi:hypothetical protein